MTKRELAVYRIEQQLIKKHFPGLQPRPIKVVRGTDFDGQAGLDRLELNARVLRRKGRDNLKRVLKHELIHYQLRNSGKDYHGHGKAFLKRAAELGIVEDYELDRCFSSEEFEYTAGIRKRVKVPREQYRKEIDQTLARLTRLVKKLPEPQRTQVYHHLNNLTVAWMVYAHAVETGQQTIWEEVLVKKRGRKGKSLLELHTAYKAVESEISKLTAVHGDFPEDPTVRQKLTALQTQEFQLWEKIEKDYGKTP